MSSSQDAGNAAAMREALSDIIDRINQWRNDGSIEHWQYSQLFDIADDALASSPRACDLMTEEELSRVVSRSIVASVSARPELNEECIKSLAVAAVTAAIKCAYDTELKSNKEANNDD